MKTNSKKQMCEKKDQKGKEKSVMKYEVAECVDHPEEWRAEASNEEGECYVVMFYGPAAEARARSYAEMLNERVMKVEVSSMRARATLDW